MGEEVGFLFWRRKGGASECDNGGMMNDCLVECLAGKI